MTISFVSNEKCFFGATKAVQILCLSRSMECIGTAPLGRGSNSFRDLAQEWEVRDLAMPACKCSSSFENNTAAVRPGREVGGSAQIEGGQRPQSGPEFCMAVRREEQAEWLLACINKNSINAVVFGNLIEVKVSFVTPKYDVLNLYQEPIMTEHALSSQESYDPNRLLDTLLERMNLKNDAALSRMLEVAPPVISKIRHRRLPIGASLLIRMHECTGMSIRELRDLMGDRRTKYRLSDAQGKPKAPPAEATPSSGGGQPSHFH